jgi:hypothetical protein
VTLLVNANLFVNTTGYSPTSSDRIFILVNDGTDTITGTFNGMPNGSTVTLGGFSAIISYAGDSATNALTGGNDVVVYNFIPVPEPTSDLGILALTGLVAGVIRRQSSRTLASANHLST